MAATESGCVYHLGAHFTDDYSWQQDPFAQEFFLSRGQTCHRWTFGRAYDEGQIHISDDIPGSLPNDVLLLFVPKWPAKQYVIRADVPGSFLLLESALVSTNYNLLSRTEKISNETCILLDQNGTDTIWVATNKGMCVMQREWHSTGKRLLTQRLTTDSVAEIAPDIWLPNKLTRYIFPNPAIKDQSDVQVTTINILRVLVNSNVTASYFVPVHKPGSIKYDNANNFSQITPGGQELLDENIKLVNRLCPIKPESWKFYKTILLVIGAVISLFGGYNMRRN